MRRECIGYCFVCSCSCAYCRIPEGYTHCSHCGIVSSTSSLVATCGCGNPLLLARVLWLPGLGHWGFKSRTSGEARTKNPTMREQGSGLWQWVGCGRSLPGKTWHGLYRACLPKLKVTYKRCLLRVLLTSSGFAGCREHRA